MSFRSATALGAALCFGSFAWGSGTVVTSPIQAFVAPNIEASGHHPEVGAFYYPWYVQAQWGCLLDMAPAMGRYDSRNPVVISDHMALAARAGLNELIVSWWGTLSPNGQRIDKTMPQLLAAAAKSGIRIIPMVDAYKGRTPQTTLTDIGHLLSQDGTSPALYKSSRPTPFLAGVQSRPVFLVYIAGTDNAWKPADWTKTLDAIHAKYNAIVLVHKDYEPSWVTVGHFDGMFAYGTGQSYNARDLAQRLPAKAWYLPTAYPGFNARRSKGNNEVVPRNGVSTYDETWHDAFDLGVDMPMVSVTSFNEWTETTQIEPCRNGYDFDGFAWEDYGVLGPMGYIDRTASWSSVAKTFEPLQFAPTDAVYCQPGWPGSNVGLWQNSWGSTGQTERACVGNAFAFKCSAGSKYLYYQVHKALGSAEPVSVNVRADYFDAGEGKFQIDYLGAAQKLLHTPQVTLKNTKAWRTATFQIPDMVVDGLAGGKNDFRIAMPQGQDTAFGLVSFVRAGGSSGRKRP